MIFLASLSSDLTQATQPSDVRQIHSLTVVQGWWMEPLPRVFDMLQYFETILSSVKSLLSSLWVVVLLEACDVTDNGHHLGFYQELEIRLKHPEIVILGA